MESRSTSNSAQEFWSGCIWPRIVHIQNATSFAQPPVIAQARQKIDDELVVMQQTMHFALCALRSQRNTLAPVSRLPSEVLARIFLFVADVLPPMTRQERSADRSLGWIQMTHVCKVWREAALHYPHLWTDIHAGLNTRWVEVVLARGKSAPISVIFDKFPATEPYWCAEIPRHVPRIRDLRLSFFTDNARFAAYQSVLTSPANNLQYLCLRHRHAEHADLWLSEHIFQDHAPLLRSVDLQNVYIPWSAPILRNLIHLKIELNFDRSSNPFILDDNNTPAPTSIGQLLDALHRMPALETLSLSNCLAPWPRQLTDDDVVGLPHLKSLSLREEQKCSSSFIQSIKIPPSCALSLLCSEGEEPEITTGILSLFHAHVTRGPAPLHSLVLSIDDRDSFFTVSRMAAGDDAETETWHTVQLPYPEVANKTMWDIVVSLCRSFPIANIRYLEIQSIISSPKQQWADALKKCRMVEEVRFQGGPDETLDFCTALAAQVDQEAGTLLLESLQCLTLDVFLDGESKSPFYRTFLDRLGTRQKSRAIQTVCLKPRMMQEDEWFIRQLEEIVPQVIYADENGRIVRKLVCIQ